MGEETPVSSYLTMEAGEGTTRRQKTVFLKTVAGLGMCTGIQYTEDPQNLMGFDGRFYIGRISVYLNREAFFFPLNT
ncbi:hypothetical protein E2C01_054340 [Portunus trituberculatus]|uniref:Uncharacterized protein n=1 Tax=Portunus trituberculatus TaxID=210409 RepID=A0A5B7GRR4_PORTR|nr:hypothetical protein [Portunus trituberculatus]